MTSRAPRSNNLRTALLLGGIVAGMFGFGFALVPLYGLLCNALGVPNLVNANARGEAPAAAQPTSSRIVGVRFDTTVNSNLPWRFEPSQPRLEVPVGHLVEAHFQVHNDSSHAITAQAIPSIVPWQATAYFHKVECFCFHQQALAPGESRELVLRFLVAPQLPAEITDLTLSYTFMNTAGPMATAPTTGTGGG